MKFPRWLIVLTSFAILAIILYIVVLVGNAFTASPSPDSVVCTADAKQCPDGSFVGRVGPHCEFAQCPAIPIHATTTPSNLKIKSQIGVSVTALGLVILPISVEGDSRCPVDVECVWAGTLNLKTQLRSARETKETTLVLGTPFAIGSQTVTLVDVTPAPHSGITISPEMYQFVFEVKESKQK